MGILDKLLSIVTPNSTKKGGTTVTNTFNPGSTTGVITAPTYRDHLVDIFDTRLADDSQELMKFLFKHDPDVSAALNSFLTMSNTEMIIIARDMKGEIDRDATKDVHTAIRLLTRPYDYTKKFELKPSLSSICESMRHMLLLRGSIGLEVVVDENLAPSELRLVDMASIEWVEKKAGVYKPTQKVPGQNQNTNLDIPSFFVSHFRKDPTNIYNHSFFVSSINTISARLRVINDLYRIMKLTGYPRMDLKIVEEILLKNAPGDVKNDPKLLREWTNTQLTTLAQRFSNIRPDQAFVHTDSVEASIINEKAAGVTLDVDSIVDTLNAQNQAALKTMATVIGRGDSGVNTASVEARIACMNADELNDPVKDVLSKALTFVMHLNGFQGFVDVSFAKVELRPDLELEPHLTMKAARLKEDLSLGLITDDEYHIQMYNRPRPDEVPELSGTGFMQPVAAGVDASNVSPNGDSLGRSIASPGAKSAKSNTVKKSTSK